MPVLFSFVLEYSSTRVTQIERAGRTEHLRYSSGPVIDTGASEISLRPMAFVKLTPRWAAVSWPNHLRVRVLLIWSSVTASGEDRESGNVLGTNG